MKTNWIDRIEEAKKAEDDWRKSAVKAVEKYRNKHKGGFNVLWPNTVLKHAAVFARAPAPVVKRRYGRNPASSQVSLMLERCIGYNMDIQPWKNIMDDVVLDWLLTGRGVVRLRYVPKRREQQEPVDIDDAGNFYAHGEEVSREELRAEGDDLYYVYNEILSEQVVYEHVPWKDYCQDPLAERWQDVRWIAFHHVMSPEAAKRDFGSRITTRKIAEIQDSMRREESGATDDRRPMQEKMLSVWEVWDKEKRKVHFVTMSDMYKNGEQVVLKTYDDPYGLEDFWPTPEPLRAIRTPGTLCPTTEYSQYEAQAEELDLVTRQLKRTMRQVRPKGMYDASVTSLKNIARVDDSVLEPVENWAAIQESKASGGLIEWWPIEQFTATAISLSQERQQLLSDIYEITGLSDILRGSTDARETATAQQIKSQFGGLRLKPMQSQLQNYIRACMEIEASLIAEHYDIDTIAAIAQMEPPQGMEQLLRSDVARQFSIDIETDSTIAMDDAQEKQNRTEFLQVFGNTLANTAEAINAGLLPQESLGRILEFALQPWRVGRELEEVLTRLAQPQPQQPDAAAQAEQAKAAIEQGKLQLAAQEMQIGAQIDAGKLQLESEKVRLTDDRERQKMMIDALKAAA